MACNMLRSPVLTRTSQPIVSLLELLLSSKESPWSPTFEPPFKPFSDRAFVESLYYPAFLSKLKDAQLRVKIQ